MPKACSWSSRLKRPLFLLWLAAIAVQLAADAFLKYTALSFPARPFIGLLPALLWILVVAAFVQAILKSDELQQRIHMQAASIASVLAIVFSLVLSELHRAGIYQANLNGVWSSLLFLLMISYVFSGWRYR